MDIVDNGFFSVVFKDHSSCIFESQVTINDCEMATRFSEIMFRPILFHLVGIFSISYVVFNII